MIKDKKKKKKKIAVVVVQESMQLMESEELKGLKKKMLQFWLKVKAKYGVFVVYG